MDFDTFLRTLLQAVLIAATATVVVQKVAAQSPTTDAHGGPQAAAQPTEGYGTPPPGLTGRGRFFRL